MNKQQELEWIEAQNLVLSTDLVSAAKQQFNFLAAVDKIAKLFDGPLLDHAIYRYKNHWLPVIAKYTNNRFQEGLLVVPLDCEWIWHCHKLNPVRYMKDCIELYGIILDNKNVVSSVCGSSTSLTEEIWKIMYPNEPYELNYITPFANTKPDATKTTNYDLVSAVKRQSSFYYQVSRPYMNNEMFLEEAEARYKGFLYLIKKNKKRNNKQFCVPTYDIDLIWHSHQLNPISYHRDSMAILGEILEHDDTDSDRTKGKKLDIGFCETTKCWEETFGSRYLRAGVMYRGSPPNLLVKEFESNTLATEYVEVFVEIVEAKNLPAGHGEGLFVSITKNQNDHFFNTKRILNIIAKPKEKQIVAFECEPNGEITFELVSPTPCKILGTTSISFDELFRNSTLSLEKWFELIPISGNESSLRTSVRIALSFTPPIQGQIKKMHKVLENGSDMKNIYDTIVWSKGGNCSGSGGCGGGSCGSSCRGGSRCGGGCGGSCRGGGRCIASNK